MRRLVARLALHGFMLAVLVFHMVPLVTMLLNAVRSNAEVRRTLLAIPESIRLENFATAWVSGNFLVAFTNTFIIGAGTITLVVVANVLAAYGLTKLRPFGRDFFIAYFVVGIAVPGFAIVVPVFFGMSMMGLVNTHVGVIIIYSAIFLPFTLLLMRSYFVGIPRELEEAALIDGCSELGAMWRVTLPLARPIIVTAVLVVFVSVYNEFLFANVMLQSDATRTIALSFYNFTGKYSEDLATIFAAAFIALAPILLLYFALQRRFVEGLAAGGLKG